MATETTQSPFLGFFGRIRLLVRPGVSDPLCGRHGQDFRAAGDRCRRQDHLAADADRGPERQCDDPAIQAEPGLADPGDRHRHRHARARDHLRLRRQRSADRRYRLHGTGSPVHLRRAGRPGVGAISRRDRDAERERFPPWENDHLPLSGRGRLHRGKPEAQPQVDHRRQGTDVPDEHLQVRLRRWPAESRGSGRFHRQPGLRRPGARQHGDLHLREHSRRCP